MINKCTEKQKQLFKAFEDCGTVKLTTCSFGLSYELEGELTLRTHEGKGDFLQIDKQSIYPDWSLMCTVTTQVDKVKICNGQKDIMIIESSLHNIENDTCLYVRE